MCVCLYVRVCARVCGCVQAFRTKRKCHFIHARTLLKIPFLSAYLTVHNLLILQIMIPYKALPLIIYYICTVPISYA